MSSTPVIKRVGVLIWPVRIMGDLSNQFVGSSQKGTSNHSKVQAGMSVVPTMDIQLVTGQSDAAAANLLSWATTHAVKIPPPLQPNPNPNLTLT